MQNGGFSIGSLEPKKPLFTEVFGSIKCFIFLTLKLNECYYVFEKSN